MKEQVKQIRNLTKELMPSAVEFRRVLHRHPELAFQETVTSGKIREELKAEGIPVEEDLLPTSVIAVISGKRPGKTILVREDIDALPMEERTGLSFSSEIPGCAHSCGHDIHTSALVLLGKILWSMREQLTGKVILVFQPAEETASGAKAMMEAGFREKYPDIDQVIGFHTDPTLDAGTIGLVKGAANASTDEVTVTVKSPGGHGAHPYRCGDPVAAAGYLLTQLQTVISRENPALEPAVLTFGMIHGGTAPNIIPTEVVMKGTLRAFDETGRKNMWDAIRRVSELGAKAMRTEAKTEIKEGVPVLYNDPETIEQIRTACEHILGAGKALDLKASPGSDDFSCFLSCAPGVQFKCGTGNEDPKSRKGIHNGENIFDEKCIETGCMVMAEFIFERGDAS